MIAEKEIFLKNIYEIERQKLNIKKTKIYWINSGFVA